MNLLKRVLLFCFVTGAALSAAAQVDGERTRQDTLYIYEEEITYDTLYIRDTLPDYTGMSKEELMDVFLQDRGVGQLYYQKGGMYLIGADELYRLNKNDLERLLSATEYENYRKAKRNQHISIPLYMAGGAALVTAGVGIYQFCASFIQTAKYKDQLLNSDNLAVILWRSAMSGVFLCAGSALAATAFIVPAVVLTVKSKVRINQIVNRFNASPTMTMQIRLGPTPTGAGITFSF
jgi:hypothetical protein